MNLPIDVREHITVPIRGIVQAGGHVGSEVPALLALSDRVVIFEPQSKVFATLCTAIAGTPASAVNLALGSHDDASVLMYVDRWEQQSSSLLAPKLHHLQYPMIEFGDHERVGMTTLDHYFAQEFGQYNFLIMDVQGYELEVLRGGERFLQDVDYILCEINLIEVYEGCPLLEDIDEYLGARGFVRAAVNMQGGVWGDALYLRTSGARG